MKIDARTLLYMQLDLVLNKGSETLFLYSHLIQAWLQRWEAVDPGTVAGRDPPRRSGFVSGRHCRARYSRVGRIPHFARDLAEGLSKAGQDEGTAPTKDS